LVEGGDRWKREKRGRGKKREREKGEEVGKHALLIKLQAFVERASTPLKYLSVGIYKGETKRLRRREPKKKIA
jgi:hypothetical protein